MPSKYQSKRSLEQRKRDNAGVRHGAIKKGKGGRTYRQYDKNTGRWNVVSSSKVMRSSGQKKKAAGTVTTGNRSYTKTKIAGSGTDAVNAKSSSGSARTSDSFVSIPRTKNPFAAMNRKARTPKTVNRPRDFPMGTAVRLRKSKDGQLRYIKVGKRRG